jgi:hypothetical protein
VTTKIERVVRHRETPAEVDDPRATTGHHEYSRGRLFSGRPPACAAAIHPDLVTTMIEWSDFVAATRKGANSVREMIVNETGNHLAKNCYGMSTTS